MQAADKGSYHQNRGVAVLATCLVQTLNEDDPAFRQRFLSHLERAYHEIRDHADGDNLRELELLKMTSDLLTTFNFKDGEGRPSLEMG